MTPLNLSFIINTSIAHPDFFFISGFVGIPHANYYYIFLCFVYAVTLLGNMFVMFMIYIDHCLHSPKYIAVLNLAVSDLCGSTALIPQMIDTFLFKSHLISFGACFSNMFFALVFITMQSFTLTVLSYDRCVAICFPLRYNEIVSNKSMLVIIAISWIIAGLADLIAVILISRQSFCKTVIKSFFCWHTPLLDLLCKTNTPSSVVDMTLSIINFWFPLFLITGTYICIARALLNIAAASERLKAMKTCSSHLIMVSMFYLPSCLYAAMASSSMLQNAMSVSVSMTIVLPPMLNPIIYTLKTEEFAESVKNLYRRKMIHLTVGKKINKCFARKLTLQTLRVN